MEFISADHLKKEFEVEGSFYNKEINSQIFECRNYAQVYRKECKDQPTYDAIFTLVNPGLCAPKNATYTISQISVGESNKNNFTLAKTDNTQYQIMRVMQLKKWNKVLLINLSDIRAGNLKEFKEKLRDAERVGFENHSIFSEERKDELEKIINQCNGPIILAWGTNPIIKDMAIHALVALPKDRIIGMEHKTPYYYHASPPPKVGKKEWLTSINNKIS